jgi:hypothetical protein
MNKKKLNKKIKELEEMVVSLNEDIDTLLGNNERKKSVVRLQRELMKSIYEIMWR